MELIMGIFIFLVFIAAALKAGVLILKILFTIIGSLIGLVLMVVLLPLGLGIASIFVIPVILIGIVAAIFKCIMFIF